MTSTGLLATAGATLAVAVSGYAVRGRSSTVFGPSVFHGDRKRRALALTFDDGPSESTPQVLELLARHGARATFFQCGANAARLPEVAREVSAAGHEIGNHTQTHPRLWLRSPSLVESEVTSAQEVLADVHGSAPRLFRPPYGVRWFGLRQTQARLGLLGVMWTTAALDWKLPAAGIVRRLRKGVANGAILCLHDGRVTRTRPDIGPTVEALRLLLPTILDAGYKLETVSEILCQTT